MSEFEKEFAKATAKVEKYIRKLAKAQYMVGTLYYSGQGVEQDYTEAVRWHTKAAERGYVDAQFNLGVMYYFGLGVKQNYAEALRWYTKAAEKGNDYAQYWADRVTKKMENEK